MTRDGSTKTGPGVPALLAQPRLARGRGRVQPRRARMPMRRRLARAPHRQHAREGRDREAAKTLFSELALSEEKGVRELAERRPSRTRTRRGPMTAGELRRSRSPGVMVGSFLNVCSAGCRRESVVTPPSRCPSCGTPLAWRDNVRLLSGAGWEGVPNVRSCHQSPLRDVEWRPPRSSSCKGHAGRFTAPGFGAR